MTGFRQYLLLAMSVVILGAAAGRLFLLNRAEFRLISSARAREALVPSYGSFHGIGTGGTAAGSIRDRPACRLLFTLRSSHLERDRDYWNEVIRRTTQGEIPVYYWGVCDSAEACDTSQEEALFMVVGFLDPYQMRSVATAAADGSTLLYNPQGILLDVITPDQDPAVTAKLIGELVY